MSVRLVTFAGLLCLLMAVALMYLAFIDVYSAEAARASAEFRGEAAPVVAPFAWPTELPPARARVVLLAVAFAAATAGSLLYLARRATACRPQPPGAA